MIPIADEKNRQTYEIQALSKSLREAKERYDVKKQEYSTVKGKCWTKWLITYCNIYYCPVVLTAEFE